jgi:hypothetical protein
MKILYLPIGEYLTFQEFVNSREEFTQNLSNAVIESYGLEGLSNDEIIILFTKTSSRDRFAIRNNLMFPIIKEHFEVIYD